MTSTCTLSTPEAPGEVEANTKFKISHLDMKSTIIFILAPPSRVLQRLKSIGISTSIIPLVSYMLRRFLVHFKVKLSIPCFISAAS